jgi:hypothetical protein
MEDDSLRIQELVQEHFEKTDLELFVQIVDTFVYEQGTNNTLVSEQIQKFLKEMEIEQEYVTFLTQRNKSFIDRNINELFQNIRIAMLVTSHSKTRQFLKVLEKDENREKRELKEKVVKLGKMLIDMYSCLNRSETYMNGRDEDEQTVNNIKEMIKRKQNTLYNKKHTTLQKMLYFTKVKLIPIGIVV